MPLSHPAKARASKRSGASKIRVVCRFKVTPPRHYLVDALNHFCSIERHVVQEYSMEKVAVVGHRTYVGSDVYGQIVGLDAVGGDKNVDTPVGGITPKLEVHHKLVEAKVGAVAHSDKGIHFGSLSQPLIEVCIEGGVERVLQDDVKLVCEG